MIDRLTFALELTAHVIEPFAILVACGFAAVAIKTFLGIARDLKRDNRTEQGGCKPRPRIDRPGGRHRSLILAEAQSSEERALVVGLMFALSALCFVGAFFFAIGPVAALAAAGVALLLAGGAAQGSKARADLDGNDR